MSHTNIASLDLANEREPPCGKVKSSTLFLCETAEVTSTPQEGRVWRPPEEAHVEILGDRRVVTPSLCHSPCNGGAEGCRLCMQGPHTSTVSTDCNVKTSTKGVLLNSWRCSFSMNAALHERQPMKGPHGFLSPSVAFIMNSSPPHPDPAVRCTRQADALLRQAGERQK